MTLSAQTPTKVNYDVLIENQPDGTFKATLLSLPDCQSVGNTEQAAIKNLRQILATRLKTAKIVSLEIENPQEEILQYLEEYRQKLSQSNAASLAIEPHPTEHPWMKFAGMYKDNPLFEEVANYIEAERNKIEHEID